MYRYTEFLISLFPFVLKIYNNSIIWLKFYSETSIFWFSQKFTRSEEYTATEVYIATVQPYENKNSIKSASLFVNKRLSFNLWSIFFFFILYLFSYLI